MEKQLHVMSFGCAGALVAALSMLLLGLAGKVGIYSGAVEMMSGWHMFFSLSPWGIFTGMVEAAFITFVFFSLFAYVYNKMMIFFVR